MMKTLLTFAHSLLLLLISVSLLANTTGANHQQSEAQVINNSEQSIAQEQNAQRLLEAQNYYRKAESYLHVAGAKQTYGLAIEHYKKASALGHKKAQAKLIWLESYLPNETSLKKRYRGMLVKAKQDDPEAQFLLAEMCEFGLGVEQNLKRAVSWYQNAADLNHGKAQNRLGELYSKGLIQDNNVISEKQAFSWIQVAANNNQGEAQFKLANFYLNGDQVEKNIETAFYWFKKSAQNNHIEGQMETGFMLKEGKGVKRNYEQALFWFEKAAAQGYEPATLKVQEVNTILDDIFLRDFK